MKNKLKISIWGIIFIISILIIILNIATFQSSGKATDGAMAFDAGQVIGILIWVGVAIFAGFRLNKVLRKRKDIKEKYFNEKKKKA